MTYNVSPGLSMASDADIEMPGDQNMWDARDAETWSRLARSNDQCRVLTVKDAVSRMLDGEASTSGDGTLLWSPFSCLVTVHAVSIQIWHMMQCLGFTCISCTNKEMCQAQKNHHGRTQIEAALTRCRNLITRGRQDRDYNGTEPEGPLLFNCVAILRVGFSRAFTDNGPGTSTILLTSRNDIVASLTRFIMRPQSRNDFVTQSIARAFEGIVLPSKMGALLVQKTAALSWGVEHALAGWDSGEIMVLSSRDKH